MSHTDEQIGQMCRWLMERDLIASATRHGELGITYRDPKRPRHPHVRERKSEAAPQA